MPLDKSPSSMAVMFDELAPRYDLMNDLMTGFMHKRTRKVALDFACFGPGMAALDLATGTGDTAFLLRSRGGPSSRVVGVDISKRMLAIARARAEQKGIAGTVEFIKADITELPFPDQSFDTITISYGIRNVEDPVHVLKEALRVTKPEGVLVVVEATPPVQPVFRFITNFYFKRMVTLIAKVFSSNPGAYRYFYSSVEEFPVPLEFSQVIKKAGWRKISYKSLLLGSVTVFRGFKY